MALAWDEAVQFEIDAPCLEAMRKRGSHATALEHSMSEADQSTRKHFLEKCRLVARRWRLDDQWLGEVMDIIDFAGLWSNRVGWLTAAMVAAKSLEEVEEHVLSMKASKGSLLPFLNEISKELFGRAVARSALEECFAREAALLTGPSGYPHAGVNATTLSIFAALRMCSLLPEPPRDNGRDWRGMVISTTGGGVISQSSRTLLCMPLFVKFAISLVQECLMNNAVVARGLAPHRLACAALFASIRAFDDAPASVHTSFAKAEEVLLGVEFSGTSKTLAENLNMVAKSEDVPTPGSQDHPSGPVRYKRIYRKCPERSANTCKANDSIGEASSFQDSGNDQLLPGDEVPCKAARCEDLGGGTALHAAARSERIGGETEAMLEQPQGTSEGSTPSDRRAQEGSKQTISIPPWIQAWRDRLEKERLQRLVSGDRIDNSSSQVSGSTQKPPQDFDSCTEGKGTDDLEETDWSEDKKFGGHAKKAVVCQLCKAKRDQTQRGVLCSICLNSIRRISGRQAMSLLGDTSERDRILTESKKTRARLNVKQEEKRARAAKSVKDAEAELSQLSEALRAPSCCQPRALEALDDIFSDARQRWGRQASKATTCHLCHAARNFGQRGVLCVTCLKSLRFITGSQRLSSLQCPAVRDQVVTHARGTGEDKYQQQKKARRIKELKKSVKRLRDALDVGA